MGSSVERCQRFGSFFFSSSQHAGEKDLCSRPSFFGFPSGTYYVRARAHATQKHAHTRGWSLMDIYMSKHTHTHSHTHWRKIDNCASCSDCFSYLPAHSSSATFSSLAQISLFFFLNVQTTKFCEWTNIRWVFLFNCFLTPPEGNRKKVDTNLKKKLFEWQRVRAKTVRVNGTASATRLVWMGKRGEQL